MGKKENAEKERREKKKKSSKNHGSVIVTVYVESSSTADQKPHRKSNSSSKSNRQNHCFRSKYGSNRKAQLLAYAQQLRSSDYKQIGWLETNLRTKRKWSSRGQSRSKCRLFFQKIFRPVRNREGYEPILSDKERSEDKSNSRRRNCSNHFCRRLRSLFKELSSGWKCNKG